MVIAKQRQHATVGRGAGCIGMTEHIAAPIDPGSFAIPDGKNAVVLWLRPQIDLLGAPDRRCRQVFVDPGLKLDVVAFQEFATAP